jgi:hypothetical protein
MLLPAKMRLSSRQLWTAAAAVAAAVGTWDLALFVFIGGVAPSRAVLARAALLDAALALPVAALALYLTRLSPFSADSGGMRNPGPNQLASQPADAGGRGGGVAAAALAALAFGALLVPAAALREAAVALTSGAATGLAGAADPAPSALDAGRWLCTAAVGGAQASSTVARDTLAASAKAALLLQIPALPAFFAALVLARRWSVTGHAVMLVAALGSSGALVLAMEQQPERASAGGSLGRACQPGLDVRIYSVSAVEVELPLQVDGQRARAPVFALNRDLPAIRAGERPPLTERVSLGPTGDPTKPLVLRAHLGECLHVVFTNRLRDLPAAFRVHGLPHLTTAEAVGAIPPDYRARPGETLTYSFQIPPAPEWARTYLVEGAGEDGGRRGPLAALVVDGR